MGLGIHIRIDPNRNRGPATHQCGPLVDEFQLRTGFDIQHKNTMLQGTVDFVRPFTNTGINNRRRIETRFEAAK